MNYLFTNSKITFQKVEKIAFSGDIQVFNGTIY